MKYLWTLERRLSTSPSSEHFGGSRASTKSTIGTTMGLILDLLCWAWLALIDVFGFMPHDEDLEQEDRESAERMWPHHG